MSSAMHRQPVLSGFVPYYPPLHHNQHQQPHQAIHDPLFPLAQVYGVQHQHQYNHHQHQHQHQHQQHKHQPHQHQPGSVAPATSLSSSSTLTPSMATSTLSSSSAAGPLVGVATGSTFRAAPRLPFPPLGSSTGRPDYRLAGGTTAALASGPSLQAQYFQQLQQQQKLEQQRRQQREERYRNSRICRYPFGMAGSSHTDEELATLQKLSNEYEPEVHGPLVGEKQPCTILTTEYANGDPIFRVKTTALAKNYAWFRTCRGDGHCGWRAIAFGYFECLLKVGDGDRMFVEESRLRSLNDLLADIGIDVLLYEDFAGATYDLLRDLAASLPPSLPANGAAATVAGKTLLDSFNDETNSANIITYLKLLTSAWIQSHPDDFRPFLPGTDIVRYCKTSIDPHLSEIDHVGIMGLFNLLLKPAGFALEVIYLDRSPGEEVNTYRLEPTPSTIAITPAPSTLHQSQRQRQQQGLPIPTTDDIPTIRLLYRPGHYDMLYKLQDIPTAVVTHHPENNFSAIGLVGQTLAQPTDLGSVTAATLSSGASSGPGGAIDPPTGSEQLYVALARPGDGFIPVEHDYAMHDWRHMIPGMSLLPSSQQWLGDGSGSASCGNSGASSNDSGTALDLFSTASLLSPNSAITPTPSFPSLPVVPLIDDYAPIVPASSQLPSSPTHSWPFRPSVWELEPELVATGSRTSPVTTSIFRNSHFNPAHFQNPDFHPEEWIPDSDYAIHRIGGNHFSSSGKNPAH